MGTMKITTEEYRELVLKAYKYDKLKNECLRGNYATTFEEILFDITDEELNLMKERRDI